MEAVSLKRRLSRGLSLAAAAALGATALAACGSSGSDGGGASSSELTDQTWIVPQDWGAMDPTKVAATNTGAILLVFEPLVLASADGGVEPNLATQSTPDPTTFVYKLRTDANFSDGNPVTIDDVLYSFEIHAAKNSTSTLAGNFSDVTSIKATGDDELTVTLAHPDVQFENTVAQIGIVEKSVRESLGKGAGSPDKPNVGSGPYVIKSYSPGSQLVLQRNADYWGAKPTAETLTLKVIPDDSARLLAVQSGDVTGAFEIPAGDADQYASAPGMKLITGSNPSVMLFNVNTTIAPWNDIHVRRAVAEAIDKEGIVNAVLKGRGTPAVSVVRRDNVSTLFSESEADTLYRQLDKNPFDLNAAKAEMAQSATPDGFDAEVVYSAVEPTSGLVAQAVAANLEPLGIHLTVKSLPDAQYTDAVFFKHTAPASIVDFTTDIPDPISLPNYLSNSKNTLDGGGYTNIAEYVNPAQDQVLNEYLQTPSDQTAKRAELLKQAMTTLSVDMPYIPIYNSDYLAVVRKDMTFNNFDGMWWMRRWVDDVTTG
jgi:peptide/nickel transport system substrate-binding protein